MNWLSVFMFAAGIAWGFYCGIAYWPSRANPPYAVECVDNPNADMVCTSYCGPRPINPEGETP